MSTASPSRIRLHRRPLVLCLAAILGASATPAIPVLASPAATLTVTSCEDSGAGSLRDTIASAVSGDTIDFSPDLACSRITLTSGAITIGQGSDALPIETLDIVGPGRNALTIDGNYLDRALVHDAGAASALTISGLAFQHGFTDGDGGCVLTQGSVSFDDVELSECAAGQVMTARAPLGGPFRGGGLSAGGTVTLANSFVGDNKVDGQSAYAYGAGVFAGGDLTLTSTTISGNFATSDTGATFGGGIAVGNRSGSVQAGVFATESSIQNNTAFSHCGYCPVRGGGAWIYGNSTFEDSVISGNTAFSDAHYGAGGGLYFTSRYGGTPVTATLTDTNLGSNSADESGGAIGANGDISITRATISGNNANADGGAIELLGGDLHLTDSTLTGNIAGSRGGGIFLFGYGDVATSNSTISGNMAVDGGAIGNTYGSLHLANSTVAFNTASEHGGGIYQRYAYYVVDLRSTIVAGNTTSGSPEDLWPPGITVTGSNDLVTAAPGVELPNDTLSADPLLQPLADNGGPTLTHALGEGSPAIDAGSNDAFLDFDQRGDGFARVAGSEADIGAFEVQASGPPDLIFADGFDTL